MENIIRFVRKYWLAVTLIVVGIIAVYTQRYLIDGETVFKTIIAMIMIEIGRFVLRPGKSSTVEAQA